MAAATFQDTESFIVTTSRMRGNPGILRKVTWAEIQNLSAPWTQWIEPDQADESTDPAITSFVQQSLPADYLTTLTPYDTARRLHRAVAAKLTYQSPPLHGDAVNVLKDGVADCGGFATLLTSCLRNVGIPARTIEGFWQGTNEWHVRTEFHLPGVEWLMADATASNANDPTGTYAYDFGYVPDADSYVAMDVSDSHLLLNNDFWGIQVPNWWWTGGATYTSGSSQGILEPLPFIVSKGMAYSQTSQNGVPSFSGYRFNAGLLTSSTGASDSGSLTSPAGSGTPVTVLGKTGWNGSLGVSHDFAGAPAMNNTYANGVYNAAWQTTAGSYSSQLNLNGTFASFNAPVFTSVDNGAWVNGSVQVSDSVAATINWSPFQGATDNLVLLSMCEYLGKNGVKSFPTILLPANATSYTLPILPYGQYGVGVSYLAISGSNGANGAAGFAGFSKQTNINIVSLYGTWPDLTAGRYTLLLSSTDTSGLVPQGMGYAAMTVSKTLGVILAGRLTDGESFSTSGFMTTGSTVNALVINTALNYPAVTTAGAKGSLAGTLTFTKNTGTSDLTGNLTWNKPPQSEGNYRGEFDTNLNTFGSLYTPPGKSESVLPGFPVEAGTASGMLKLTGTSGAILSATCRLSTANKLIIHNPPDKLAVTINPSTGVFTGSFMYPPAPGRKAKLTDIYGALFQDQTLGRGFFFGPDGSGTVSLTPSP